MHLSTAAPLTLIGPRGSPNGRAEVHGCLWHSTHGHQPTPIQAMREKNRLQLPLQSFRPPSPSSGSGWGSTGCKHQGQYSGHQFCCGAFQVGAGVWKGSACCIRQLRPCKGQGCFGKEMFAEAFPSPRCLLSAPRLHTRAHTLALLQPTETGKPHKVTLLCTKTKSRTPQQLRSTPKAQSGTSR